MSWHPPLAGSVHEESIVTIGSNRSSGPSLRAGASRPRTVSSEATSDFDPVGHVSVIAVFFGSISCCVAMFLPIRSDFLRSIACRAQLRWSRI